MVDDKNTSQDENGNAEDTAVNSDSDKDTSVDSVTRDNISEQLPDSVSDVAEQKVGELEIAEQGEKKEPKDPIEALKEKLEEKHGQLLRYAAELDNLRKRSRRDIEDAAVRGRSEVLKELLPTVDSIDLALDSIGPEGSAKSIIEGMQMVKKKFLTSLERFGLKEIEAVGLPFDPNFHEAIAQQPSEKYDAGIVAFEMRRGYLLGEKLLRPTMVVVSSGKPQVDEKAEEKDDLKSNEEPESNEERLEADTENVDREKESEGAEAEESGEKPNSETVEESGDDRNDTTDDESQGGLDV